MKKYEKHIFLHTIVYRPWQFYVRMKPHVAPTWVETASETEAAHYIHLFYIYMYWRRLLRLKLHIISIYSTSICTGDSFWDWSSTLYPFILHLHVLETASETEAAHYIHLFYIYMYWRQLLRLKLHIISIYSTSICTGDSFWDWSSTLYPFILHLHVLETASETEAAHYIHLFYIYMYWRRLLRLKLHIISIYSTSTCTGDSFWDWCSTLYPFILHLHSHLHLHLHLHEHVLVKLDQPFGLLWAICATLHILYWICGEFMKIYKDGRYVLCCVGCLVVTYNFGFCFTLWFISSDRSLCKVQPCKDTKDLSRFIRLD